MFDKSAPIGGCSACVVFWGDDLEEDAELASYLTEVVVEASRGEATQATLSFSTRRHRSGRWAVQDSEHAKPWVSVRIEARFGAGTREVMRGYVREVRADYPAERDSATVKVICQDESLALDRQHRRRVWGGDATTYDRTIIDQIAGLHGLRADCRSERSGVNHKQDATDIQFLTRLARERGYEIYVRQGELYFGPMRLDEAAQKPIMVYAGPATNCRSISIQDDGHRPDAVAIDIARPGEAVRTEIISSSLSRLGLDPADSGDMGLEDFVWHLRGQGSTDIERVRDIARQKADAASMKLRAEGELDGLLYLHVLETGRPVDLSGAGERYDGTWYVDTVTHRFDDTGYSQRFRLLRNARGASGGMAMPAARSIGALA